ncbi:probable F420-dependent oxidoreductase, MSMEG_4141 family [Enhydrobacter aerosaccus]|uniref:Probable F420-dependent oxidoreductase, MSMEG_4141 family n=1 Tax=Enhydrobacter aerosaccus TaxID=225324 RepID=A0A1T4P0C0_9HYPH|nr:TIGR03620 family F420-dependent LLM class oxidoreductase [Enhydrobacter aerosaccus]SJZ84767.1 probable F420-dependent oxidoreductase, MSMEG_4141 family [Enhydrobacter aerosaccus]
MKLGRLGVWYSTDKLNGAQLADLIRTVETCGYSAFWYPEARGYESMSLASYLLSKSERLMVGSSIANIYARDAFTAQRAMVSMNSLYGGRFMLGLGVSHIPMVEGLRGHRYDKPVATMRAYLDGIHKDLPADTEAPVLVAALGPKMLALSAEKSMGAVPYNVTPKHTAEAAKILGPNKVLAVEQKVTVETDPARARELGRKELARYLVLPNYRNNWLRLGFTEQDLADGGSDRFIDAMVLWGDADAVRKGLRAHFEAGATHVCLQPVHADGDFAARDRILEALADT